MWENQMMHRFPLSTAYLRKKRRLILIGFLPTVGLIMGLVIWFFGRSLW